MTPVDIDKLKELYERANEPEPTNLVTHDSVERPRASTNAMIWRDWHHRRDLAARELLDLTPALIAKAERVDALMDLIRRAQLNVPEYYVDWHEAARNALSPKESE